MSTQNKNCCRSSRRRGLTLLELVVVMAILAGLAAVLIPLFPNMLAQSHSSAAATNVAEVSKAVQMYNSQNSLYPYNLDSLVAGGSLITYLPSNSMSGFTNSQIATDLTPTVPSASDISALNSAGVTAVLNMAVGATSGVTNSVWSPTFYPYGDGSSGAVVTPTSTSISTAPTLAVLSTLAAQRLGLSTPNTYYVFGLGDFSSMQGTAMDQAPVHWMANMTMSNGTTMSMSPSTVYSRFGLVFQTTTSGGATALSTAKYVGTVLLTGTGVANGSKPMSTYLSSQQ